MKSIQQQFVSIIFSIFIVFITISPSGAAEESGNAVEKVQKPSQYLVVTYFHTTFRCPTCERIEELSSQAVSSGFPGELKSGKVVWRVINVDEPENKHYNDDYQMYTKHLIVSEIKDGQETRWKDLKKIWTLVRSEEKFDAYVKDEISDWLKE